MIAVKLNKNTGGLFGVEKVEPDPLNLSVNTVVGSFFELRKIEMDECSP
jgi:hypothetical protein